MQDRTTDPDAAARRALAEYRLFATGLLVLMGCLTLASYLAPPGWPAELLQAAAEAGMVGGIADWFAVTALFRHPLGLPVPHTAIIPSNKERIGLTLGRFVENNFLARGAVAEIAADARRPQHSGAVGGPCEHQADRPFDRGRPAPY